MRIAYNPKSVEPLKVAPTGDYLNAITFDLAGHNIFTRGEMFKGTDTTYDVFKKATSTAVGYNGLVPAPSYSNLAIRFLREDGTWQILQSNSQRPIDVDNNNILLSTDINKSLNLVAGNNIVLEPQADLNGNFTGEVIINTTFEISGDFDGTLADAFTTVKVGAALLKASNNKLLTLNAGTGITLTSNTTSNTILIAAPIFTGATANSIGTSGIVPTPAAGKHNTFLKGDGTWEIPTDTKNTAGSTNSTSKLYLIGATSQAANPQTYSNSKIFATDGILNASTFVGNLDGTYINKLTGYNKATAISSIATTDTLNTALGKLEFKTDFIYNDLFGTDNDDVINKWHEIVDFIDSVKEGTDITDEFVTRKTALTITGSKTFNSNIIMGTSHYIYGLSERGGAMIFFDGTRTVIGSVGASSTASTHIRSSNYVITVGNDSNTADYVVLHSGNSYINNGTITINGTSITPLTTHQSLANYVTLNTAQTISGVKTFSSLLKFTYAGAPFTVSNSTVVTNLNADLLDGIHKEGLLTSISNTGSGANKLLSITVGGTTKSILVGNSQTLEGYYATNFARGGFVSYNSITNPNDLTSGWYTLCNVSDAYNAPVILSIRTYAHSTMLVAINKGFNAKGCINILGYTASTNAAYYNIKGIRLLSNGSVLIQLVRSSGNNVIIKACQFNCGDNANWATKLVADETIYPTDSISIIDEKIGIDGKITVNGVVIAGGTSSHFLKADGSLDNTSYVTTTSLENYVKKSGDVMTGSLTVPDLFKVTNTSGNQRILIGNLDGANTPAVITGANGNLFFGRGDSWTNGGNVTLLVEIKSNLTAFNTDISIRNYGTSWEGGMTNAAIKYNNLVATNDNYYHPIFAVKLNNSNVMNIGYYKNHFGFYGYKSTRTENGTDYYFYCNTDSGSWHCNNSISSVNFIKLDSNNYYLLLGGGGHKPISDFLLKSELSGLELTNNLTTISKTLAVSTEWVDTGIIVNPETFPNGNGSYIVQVARGVSYVYTGVMTLLPSLAGIVSHECYDEVVLHGGGFDMTTHYYLRTVHDTTNKVVKIQIARGSTHTSSYTFNFKFKKII